VLGKDATCKKVMGQCAREGCNSHDGDGGSVLEKDATHMKVMG
jgi:hypothetical protein